MADDAAQELLESVRHHFRLYKRYGEGALKQLREEDFYWQPNPEVNSIQIIIQHLNGNMLSRWTDFLTSDGEKPTRNRDGEFENSGPLPRERLNGLWEEGWACLFAAVDALTTEDLLKDVTIRGQKMSVIEALNRQATHAAYHMGQIVHIAKERLGTDWKTLSIPRGASAEAAATITKNSDRYRGN